MCPGSFSSSLRPPETFFKVIFWLGYFNSCLNPIIYPCYSREFKQVMPSNIVSRVMKGLSSLREETTFNLSVKLSIGRCGLFVRNSFLCFQAFIRILRCRWKRKRQGLQAYYNYRRNQGSNNSSFRSGSQQTLSSFSPSPRCSDSKSRPVCRPSCNKQVLLPGLKGRGGSRLVSPLAQDGGEATVQGLVMNGQSTRKEVTK